MSNPTRIAILCANGLGDAMVQMVLANNLAKQGLDVTFYSDIAASLDSMVDGYRIAPFPTYDVLLTVLQDVDLCLYDSSGHYVRNMPSSVEQWCISNAVCFRMSDAPPRHTAIRNQDIQARLSSSPVSATQFKTLNASLRGKYNTLYRPPVVMQLRDYLDHKVGLADVVLGNGLTGGVTTRDETKVLLHPTGSNTKKWWPANNYLTLIRELKDRGFTPSVTVSPPERQVWLELVNGDCDVPLFETIKDLAVYYADAAYFIGSDSGNAHLASCLGVPTLQLFSGWKAHPAWRAGWGQNRVITAKFPHNLIKRHWQKGVSVDRVMSEMLADFTQR